MKVYILPDMREKFAKQVERASKHLEAKPKVTYSEPMMKRETTILNFREDGVKKNVRMVEVIEVEIEEITSGDWKLVADVLYRDGIVGMVDAGLYKSIPERLGINYIKCDYCGHTHPNRKEASIVYNTKTGEWKQIGTTCGKKMFRGGDLCQFYISLYNVIDMCGGCTSEGFGSWCAKLPDNTWRQGYSIDCLIPAVVNYRREFNDKWEKPIYEEVGRKWEKVKEGTTEIFKEKFLSGALNGEVDNGFIQKVKSYVDSLPWDEWEDGINEEGFNTKIKRAFENEYIQLFDIYTVFFAVKNYEESLTEGDWEATASKFPVGEWATLRGAKLTDKQVYDDIYGMVITATFECGGVTFRKDFSSMDTFEKKFKEEDGTYTFSAEVKYISDRKRYIGLGGRVKKAM